MTIKEEATQIVKCLQDAGYQAVFAGGCVRDSLLGLEPKDYDIATEATPEQIEKVFHNKKISAVGRDFGVMLLTGDLANYEIATFRIDGEYTDTRHPDSVKFGSMFEDAQRRDFTINAMFIDPINNEIYDFVNGRDDINNKVIRFVGHASERIKEDPVRMLRAVRFEHRLPGFKLSPIAITQICTRSAAIQDVASERLALEISKMLLECNPIGMFNDLLTLGLLSYIIPELIPMKGCEQPPQFHPEGDVWDHTLLALDYAIINFKNPSIDLLWAILLHDVGKPKVAFYDEIDKRWRFNNHDTESAKIAEVILKRLRFSNHFVDNVVDLIANHMRMADVQKMRTAKLKRFIFKPNFKDHLNLHMADCMGSHGDFGNVQFCIDKLQEFINEVHTQKVELPKSLVNGNDLIALGFKKGPIFREILEYTMDGQLENKFDNKEDGIKYLLNKFNPGE